MAGISMRELVTTRPLANLAPVGSDFWDEAAYLHRAYNHHANGYSVAKVGRKRNGGQHDKGEKRNIGGVPRRTYPVRVLDFVGNVVHQPPAEPSTLGVANWRNGRAVACGNARLDSAVRIETQALVMARLRLAEDVGAEQLDQRRNAALRPVMDALGASRLGVVELFCERSRAAKLADQGGVGVLGMSHA